MHYTVLGLIFLILTGCTRSNHAIPLDPPAAALDTALHVASNSSLVEFGNEIPNEWWTLFNDCQLNEIIQKTLIQNPTLQSAQAQIMASLYNAARVRSFLFPYIYLGADVSRQKLSRTGVIPFASGPTGTNTPVVDVPISNPSVIPEYFTLYETELNLRYSFDFWKKRRNAFCAALGVMQANIAEEAFTRLNLSIAVAEVYYELQVNYKRLEIAKALVENRSRYAEQVQKRLKANLDTELSLQTAEFTYADAKDHLLEIEGNIAVNEYQLMAYMSGDFDEKIEPLHYAQITLPRVPIPEDLPLRLISQRPDISAQLWMIYSAGKQIEIAKAGFYPDFNLAAFFGFQTIHFKELFKWPSTFFNVDPAMTLPIFDGGRLIAELRRSEIDYDLEILEYNELVINAAREVLEALEVLKISLERLKEIGNKFEHQSELYRLTSLRVSHSLNSSLDQLVVQGNMLIAEDQEAISLGRSLKAVLELIKSLGGGYGVCEG